jgi:hypothetical protein
MPLDAISYSGGTWTWSRDGSRDDGEGKEQNEERDPYPAAPVIMAFLP